MRRRPSLFVVLLALCLGAVAQADSVELNHGGGTFLAGSVVNETVETPGDTFIAVRNAVALGSSQGDLHVAGFNVSVSADAAKDLYALGATVVFRGRAAEELTAAGVSVRTKSTSETHENARLFGNTLTIEGPMTGALMAPERDVILNAPIQGDARIIVASRSFGPEAVVGGTLAYGTEQKMSVPERVAPTERVKHERASLPDAWDGFDEIRREIPVLPTFMSMFSAFIVPLLFFVVLGALMRGFMPKRLEAMRRSISRAQQHNTTSGLCRGYHLHCRAELHPFRGLGGELHAGSDRCRSLSNALFQYMLSNPGLSFDVNMKPIEK